MLENIPILSRIPLEPLPLPSRNLRVLHRLVRRPAHQPTRMFPPKIALHTTIHHSSHFLHPQPIGNLCYQGKRSIILR